MIYTINRYPAHLIDVLQMRAGRRVVIRPTLPQDVEAQRAFFRGLSSQSRYRRFLTRMRELPDTLIERFTNIDYRRHVALLAEIWDAARRQTMVGEARYVVDEGDPATCEFAVAVADEWQAQGIAKAMLARLEQEASATGIHKMVADTLTINEPMLALARRAGYMVCSNMQDRELLRLEKVLVHPNQAVASDQVAA